MMNNPFDFKWVFGTVENVQPPETKEDDKTRKSGLVQVRLLGLHSQDKNVLKTKDLPWARVMLPATSPCSTEGSTGKAPVGLTVGAMFVGVALDETYRDIMIMNTWWADGTLSPLTRGEDTQLTQAVKDEALTDIPLGSSNRIDEPTIDRSTVEYPLCDVEVSRGGLVSEIDNTGGKVRETKTHPSKAYENRSTQGDYSRKDKSWIQIVLEDKIVRTLKNVIFSVGSNLVKWVEGDVYIRSGDQTTLTSKKLLTKAEEGFEVDTPEMRLSGVMRVGEKLFVPELHVGSIKVDNISVSGEIDGIAKYAKEAVKAASIAPPVTPKAGSGPDDTSSNLTFEDNGGDYELTPRDNQSES